MVPRSAPALIALIALAVTACTGAAAPVASPSAVLPVTHAPRPTPIVSSPAVDPSTPPATQAPSPDPWPNTGDVDGFTGGPELTIEGLDDDTILATLDDPEAKAWRLVIEGTDELEGERWEIVVETGDIGPVITATEIRDGEVVDVLDLTGFGDETAAAGGCHAALPVCIDSEGFDLPDGDGRFSVRLDLPDADAPLLITGGTAGWDGEPFILGEWHDTEAFPWGEG